MSNQVIKSRIDNSTTVLIDELEDILEDILREQKPNGRKDRVWVRNWIARRSSLGASSTLLQELRAEDISAYRNHLRMEVDEFDELLLKVSNDIQRQNTTHMRNAIPARTKLEVTLRFLATGDSYGSLEFLYRIPRSTMCEFIPEIYKAIGDDLKSYIQVPSTTEEWGRIEESVRIKWNFPGCIGAIDGKHVNIKAPTNCGSDFFNYKGCNSIVLLALVDDDYCFSYVDVGSNGRASDGGVFTNFSLFNLLKNKTRNIPKDAVVVGDEGFGLTPFLMRPYPFRGEVDKRKIIFNYRLSRARRIVENAFGILVSRFRIFQKHIAQKPPTVDVIVIAACSIHNWLRKTTLPATVLIQKIFSRGN
ncbi:hypothetical protein JTB14_018678 [Gonioctena quinquepunctata]|nr:hypothetical protein JTB14_018678 [Gonioctena quinquepunctata]